MGFMTHSEGKGFADNLDKECEKKKRRFKGTPKLLILAATKMKLTFSEMGRTARRTDVVGLARVHF